MRITRAGITRQIWEAAVSQRQGANVKSAAQIASAMPITGPRGTITPTRQLIREALDRRDDRAVGTERPSPSVRQVLADGAGRRIAKLLDGNLPDVAGAGARLITGKPSVREWAIRHSTGYGDQSLVANAYRYPVMDHLYYVVAPWDCECRTIGGVDTYYCRRDVATTDGGRTAPMPAQTIKHGRGYDRRFIACVIYRGRHYPTHLSAKAVVNRYRRERRKHAESRLARRLTVIDPSRVWITPQSAADAGACGPGLDSAIRQIKTCLGEIGAIRLDSLQAMGGVYESWAARIALHGRVLA